MKVIRKTIGNVPLIKPLIIIPAFFAASISTWLVFFALFHLVNFVALEAQKWRSRIRRKIIYDLYKSPNKSCDTSLTIINQKWRWEPANYKNNEVVASCSWWGCTLVTGHINLSLYAKQTPLIHLLFCLLFKAATGNVSLPMIAISNGHQLINLH